MKEYRTIANQVVSNTIIIDKSRFITHCKGVNSVEEAIEFVGSISKQYYDATHNCYAYIVGDKAKFSDNGEPQGTAGLPILECIKNTHLDKVAVVVTRYFGGIKLGAGGLVRAYSSSCSNALSCARILQYQACSIVNINMDYNLVTIVKRTLDGLAIVQDTIYDNIVTLQCLCLDSKVDSMIDKIIDITNGKAVCKVREQLVCPYGE